MKLYKDYNNLWYFNSRTMPSGTCQIEWVNGPENPRIIITPINQSSIVYYDGDCTRLQKEDKSYYESVQDFKENCGGFFIKASASGGSTSGVSSVAGKSGDVTLTKNDVGLSNVNNTSDLNKPVSTATQNFVNEKVGQVETDLNQLLINLGDTSDENSGAGKIGVSIIPTLQGNTVQDVLESAKKRFDDISLINVDVEVANTHIGSNGVLYSSLPERLDSIDVKLFANTFQDVSVYGARGDGITDDTESIQRALDKKGHVVIRQPGTYVVSTLTIDDDTTFELYTDVVLKLKNGTKNHLLVNKYNGTQKRNKNIKIIGGSWDGNRTNNATTGSYPTLWPGIGILFNGVDGLEIRDIITIGNFWKYCFLICNCNSVITNNVHFNSFSDGFHFQGFCENILIENTSGYTGDNMIAFINADYSAYILSPNGTYKNVVVRNVKVEGMKVDAIRLEGSGQDQTGVFENFLIENISGYMSGNAPIVQITTDTVTDGGLYLNYTKVKNIVIRNVSIPNRGGTFMFIFYAVSGDITVENVGFSGKVDSGRLISLKGNIDKIILKNIYSTDAATAVLWEHLVRCEAGSTIKNLIMENWNVKLVTTNEGGLINIEGNSVKNIFITNCNFDLTCNLIRCSGSSAETVKLFVGNTKLNLKRFGAFYTPITIFIDGCEITSTNELFTVWTGANVRLISSGSKVTNVFDPGGGIMSCSGANILWNKLLSALTPVHGDIIFADNVSEPTGKGLYVYITPAWVKIS